jgi:hypothetical protein
MSLFITWMSKFNLILQIKIYLQIQNLMKSKILEKKIFTKSLKTSTNSKQLKTFWELKLMNLSSKIFSIKFTFSLCKTKLMKLKKKIKIWKIIRSKKVNFSYLKNKMNNFLLNKLIHQMQMIWTIKMNLRLWLLNVKTFWILNKLKITADSPKTKFNRLQMIKISLAMIQISNNSKSCQMIWLKNSLHLLK